MNNIKPVFPPTDQIDPAKKGEKWHRQWMRYIKWMDGATHNKSRRDSIATNRSYAYGKQDVSKYRKPLGITNEDWEKNESYRNVDLFAILPFASKALRIITEITAKQPSDLRIDAVDDYSQDQKATRKAEIEEHVINKELYKELESISGVAVKNPIPAGVPEPQGLQDVPITIDMYMQLPQVIRMKDELNKTFKVNNWDDKRDMVIEEAAICGISGTRTVMGNRKLDIQVVVPENLILPYTRQKDLSDAQFIAEKLPLTMGELRKLDYKNEISEQDFLELAAKISPNEFSSMTFESAQMYFDENYAWPWDGQSIECIYAEWYSEDIRMGKKTKDKFGNAKIWDKPYDWDPADEYKAEIGDKKVYRNSYTNIYHAMYIPDIDKVFDFGMVEGIERNREDYSDAKFSFRLRRTNTCFIEEIIPLLDDIQVNFYMAQHLQSQMEPSGQGYNVDMLDNLELASGDKISWKKNQKMKRMTGDFLFRPDKKQPQIMPTIPNPGGDYSGLVQCWENIIRNLSMVDKIIGLNEVTDGSTPNPDIGKKVSELMVQSSSNALGYIHKAFKNVHVETAKRVSFLLPEMARTYDNDDQLEISEYSKSLAKYEFDVTIQEGLDKDRYDSLMQHLKEEQAKDNISAVEAIQVSMYAHSNIDKAIHLLMKSIEANQKRKQQESQAAIEQQGQQIVQQTKAASEGKLLEVEKKEGMITEREMMREQAQTQRDREKMAHEREMNKDKVISSDIQQSEKHEDALDLQKQKDAASLRETAMKLESAEKIAEKNRTSPKDA